MSGEGTGPEDNRKRPPDVTDPQPAPAEPEEAAPQTAPRISMRLDLGLGKRLGPGKVSLLEAIRRQGSIAGAGREFGMSYRRAWLLVDELNRMFAEPLVETRGGGQGGGGAHLTAEGERIVQLYRAVEQKTRESAAAELSALEAALAPPLADLAAPSAPREAR